MSAPTLESFAERLVAELVGDDGDWPEPVDRDRRLSLAGRILAAGQAVVARLRGVDGVAPGLHDGRVGEPEVVITFGGVRVYTITQAAPLLELPTSHLRTILTRAGDAAQPVAWLDSRRPLYDLGTLRQLIAGRARSGDPSP